MAITTRQNKTHQNKGLLAVAASVVGLVLAGVGSAGPAGAEINSDQQTDWGLATEGPSRTVGQWDALGWAVEQVDGTIFVGGKFLDVTDSHVLHSQPHLAAFDADTGAWHAWFRPDVAAPVLALQASPDGALFVGGEIDAWNGETLGAMAKIDPTTGELWPGWSTRVYGAGSAVRDFHIGDDGWLYIVGDFNRASRAGIAQTAGGAIRIDPVTGVIDSSWKPILAAGSGRGISTSEVSDLVFLSGNFLSVNAEPHTGGFVGLDDDANVVIDRTPVPFNGCSDETRTYCVTMYDVEASADGLVFVGGVEHALYVLDENDDMALRYHHYSGCDPSRNDPCQPKNWYGGEFQEIEEADGRIYATCHCWYDLFSADEVIPHTRPQATAVHGTVDALLAFDPATGARIESFRPYLTGDAGGWGLHVNPADGCLWATGGFDTYVPAGGVQRGAYDLLRLCDEAGPGPAAQPSASPPPPAACVSTAIGTDATVAWTNTTGVASTILERSVDGGNWYWRGRVEAPDGDFGETVPDNRVTSYRLRFRYVAGQSSVTVECDTPIDLTPDLGAPASCSTTVENPVDGTAVVTISWQPGQDAARYVVYRSVDGANSYWRGRSDAPTLQLTDTVSVGVAYDYGVLARAADGTTSPLVPCGPTIEIEPPALAPVASCEATDAGGLATVTWPAADGADSYIVYRSVDGGDTYWRGRVDAPTTSFDDSIFDGAIFAYSVAARGPSGQLTTPTPCGTVIDTNGDPILPITGCTATEDGSASTIDWAPSPNATSVIIERSGDGGPWYWRGRVDSPGTTFVDPLRSGVEWTYRVTARDAAGTRTASTLCS